MSRKNTFSKCGRILRKANWSDSRPNKPFDYNKKSKESAEKEKSKT